MKIEGKRIAITSALGHSTHAYEKLRRLGASVYSLPLVELGKRRFKIPRADAYVFTSAEGVKAVFAKLGKGGFSEEFLGSTIFAIGPVTASSLRKLGLKPRMPQKYHSVSLANLILKTGVKNVTAFRSSRAGSEMKDALKHIRYREITAYEIRPIKRQIVADIIFVTSATAAGALPKTRAFVVSIGPHTSRALKKKGFRFIEAKRHTLNGMIAALKSA